MAQIIDLKPEETATHRRAFSVYSSLDPELSSSEREALVAERLKADVDDVHSWASAFDWEQKLAQDAQIVQKGLDARTRKERLREKAEAIITRISKLLDSDETMNAIKIDDGKTLSQLAGAMDKMVHTVCMLDGTAVDTVILKSDKPISELSDEELARYVAEGRARAASRVDDGPEAA
ncbi:MAG: hypothetical protein ACYDH4_12955 [Candidatus Cryosericum sp.]